MTEHQLHDIGMAAACAMRETINNWMQRGDVSKWEADDVGIAIRQAYDCAVTLEKSKLVPK